MSKRITILVLALAGLLLAGSKTGAKTYTFTLDHSAVAGTAQLKPGEYHLKVDGAQVVLIDKDGKQIDTTAMVETAERKFDATAIATTDADGTNRLLSIEFRGSRSRVVFQAGSL
jgi:hypothetical protein